MNCIPTCKHHCCPLYIPLIVLHLECNGILWYLFLCCHHKVHWNKFCQIVLNSSPPSAVGNSVPSNYLNQCWFIVNWTLSNKIQRYLNQNTKVFFHWNASENVVCEMAAFRPGGDKWPSDAIWRHRSRSTLAQVMACCLTAPSHYLNQCWLIISKFLWYSLDIIIIRRFEDTNQ